MTTLAITPNWKNKSAKFKGTVAAGEHVSVTIQNENGEGEAFIADASTLRLRVVDPANGRTLAIFPEPVPEGETPETWDADLSPLRCTLNLNTVQMLKAVPPAANVPLLWVLDDYENKTLYFKEQFPVEHWPRQRGEEEPTDLDNYKDLIAEFNTRLDAAEENVANSEQAALAAETAAIAARDAASAAATAATDAQAGAIASKNAAQTAANNAASSAQTASAAKTNAEQAALAAESARDAAANSAAEAAESAAAFVVDDTFSTPGAAADAKAVGEANHDLITRIETVQGNLNSEVTARETLAAAVGDNRQNLAAEASRAQAAERALTAEVSSAQSAIADRYTKTEVDAKIAGVQTFKKYLVQTLPAADEADMKGLYLVPTGETTPEGDLCEEWTVVEEDGEKRWEKIGGTTVDLSNYYTKGEADALLAGKMPSTATGSDIPVDATSGSPTLSDSISTLSDSISTLSDTTATLSDSISTLNDTKASKADATLTGRGYSAWTIVVSPPQGMEFEAVGQPYYEYNRWQIEVRYRATGEEEWEYSTYERSGGDDGEDALHVVFGVFFDCTRTALSGYQLGSQSNKPLASEAEAEALRTEVAGKLDKSGGTMTGALSFLPQSGMGASIAPFTDGFLLLSGLGLTIVKVAYGAENNTVNLPPASGTLALTADLPYTLGTPQTISTASQDTSGSETIDYGAATMADRTGNYVAITAALDELRITFPSATSGKVRDFGLRVEIGTGSAALTAPALVPIAPTGETIKIENNAAEIPALADGTATAKGVTLLYFSETAPGVFVVKGEQVEEVA